MAVILVTSALQLSAALATVKAGDTIRLAPGNYGDVQIQSKTFATEVTITSADPNQPAVMRSLVVYNSSGLNVDNVDVNLTPDATTVAHTSAVRIRATAASCAFDGKGLVCFSS